MSCYNKNQITIYQGFGTLWNDESLLTIDFDSEILLDGFGAEFSIGNIVKTYQNIQDGFIINLTASETATLPLGPITGTLVIIDTENNKRPFSTELPFLVKDWAEGDIKLDGFDISINAKIQENKLTIHIQSANPDSTVEEKIKRYIEEHNQSEEAHPYIQGLIETEKQDRESADEVLQSNIEAEQERAETAEGVLDNKIESETIRATNKETELENAIQAETLRAVTEENKKVDKVSTANRVYGTDGNGDQTTYPVDGFGKVDDVRVGGVSVVQNKIANLGTMASETASDYRKASAQDTIDSGLDDRIDTLESYTPSNASSSNKFAVESEITNLQNTKQDNIADLSTIRSNAQAGKLASDTIATYGNIVTHNVSEFATSEQGALADTALQPGDNITELVNNADYATNTQVGSAISTHNTSESAHSYIQGLISSEESRAEGVEGTLSNLTTDVKNNLVSAINEVDSHADTNASDISDIKALIPNDASSSNQLADKNFVNSSIATNTANFIGTFNSVADLEAYSGTLTNNDYAFVVGTDTAGNTVYDRYKYTDATTPASWVFEYELNNSSFTADQWAAINSLATAGKITQITTNQNAIGTLSSLTTTSKTNLVSAINELNSNKVNSNTAITGATKCKITYDSKGLVTGGADLSASDIPSLTLSKISDVTATASELNVLDGITASTTELNYTDGVTSNIQTQLNGKQPTGNYMTTDTIQTINQAATKTFNGRVNFIGSGDANAIYLSTDTRIDVYGTSNTVLGFANGTFLINNSAYPLNLRGSGTRPAWNSTSYLALTSDIGNATLTIQKNGTAVDTFTANATSDKTINITVPTKTSDLTNDDGFITGITSAMIITALGYTPYNSTNPNGYQANILEGVQVNGTDLTITNKKVNVPVPTQASDIGAQPTLVSGTNIKTVNSQSLLGSGNIEIQSAPDVDNKSISLNSSDELQTIGVIDQNNTSTALKQWSGTKAQYDAIATKDANTIYNITDDTNPTQALLEAIYPVGAIYIGTMSICPLSALFGTWQLVAQDRVLQGAGNRGVVGSTLNERLPNIKGYFAYDVWQSASYDGGAFYNDGGNKRQGTGTDNNSSGSITRFDASRVSSTYQDNAPVQQDAYLVNIWKRIE